MKFKRLKLNSFKSFVEPINFEIEDGLTGIVGPNGCGKSNIVEAFRWVMGESSPKQMRSEEMDEVIFGGTSGRPARDIAEVSLTLDNSKNKVKNNFNDYDELEVKRRIERGKGSAWTINSQSVRAKDVNLLFADNSTGAKSTGIVSQGQISEIINSKPEIRRGILEDAANIRGLHQRRHEAELRLKAAEINLQRVEDIIITLQEQKRNLNKQVRQANRYKSVASRLRTAEAAILTKKFETKDKQLKEINIEYDKSLNELSKIKKELKTIEIQKEEAESLLPNLRNLEATASAGLQKLKLTIENFDHELNQINNNKDTAIKNISRLNEDIEREKRLTFEAKEKLSNLSKEKDSLIKEEKNEKTLIENAKININKIRAESIKADKIISDLNAQTQSKSLQIDNAKTEKSKLIALNEKLSIEQTKLKLKEQKTTLSEDYKQLQNLESKCSLLEKKISDSNQKTTEIQSICNMTKDDLNKTILKRDGLQNEIQTIKNLLPSKIDQNNASLAKQLIINKGYEVSVGDVLGESIFSSIEPGAIPHWSNEKSKVSLKHPTNTEPILNYLNAPSKAELTLSGIGICKSPEEAKKIQNSLHPGQALTTIKGGLWRWDGYTIPIESNSTTSEILRQSARLKTAEEEIKNINATIILMQKDHKNNEDNYNSQCHLHEKLLGEFNEIEEQKMELNNQYQQNKTNYVFSEERSKNIEQERADICKTISTLDQILSKSDSNESEISKIKEFSDKAEKARLELAEAMSNEIKLKEISILKKQRITIIENEVLGWTIRFDDASKQVKELDKRLDELKKEIKLLEELPNQIIMKKKKVTELINHAENELKRTSDQLVHADNQYKSIDSDLRKVEISFRSSNEKVIRNESEKKVLLNDIKVIEDQILNSLNTSPDQLRKLAGYNENEELPSLDDLESRINRLTRERDEMGPVNLRAEEEVNIIDEQINNLSTESKDLEHAISKLRLGIKELNNEGKERLLSAFSSVQKHFQMIFKKLFDGGVGKLEFSNEEDPLNSGLEIMASPPGKKLQSLSLLSGGEKALTAISLLFAVFLTNPSPIYILDEVDAPLDDNNVARLCELLEEIKRDSDTRFMIITHHRLTMAKMDRLYGVTMSEKGISQLVSVNLQGAIELKNQKENLVKPT